jgi:imidazolonepropionase-like amidohydrolase
MKARFLLSVVMLCIIVCGCTKAQEPKTQKSILLQNVQIVGSKEPTNILIEGARIVDIGSGLTEANTVLDCSGLTALPGFIDTHVHLGFFQPKQVLAGGLTTVRDLGWEPTTAYGWIEASEDPNWGPKVLAAGPMLTVPGGYPFRAGWAPPGTATIYEPGTLAKLEESGSSVVKVTLEPGAGPTMSEEQLKQLVTEAQEIGLKVVAHVSTVEELRKALNAGVQEYCHFVFDDSAVPQDVIIQMVDQGVVVVPTLRVNPTEKRLANLANFHAAAGKVVYGTDLGNGGRPGIDIAELELMSKAGMSPADILKSATHGAAEHLGLLDRGRLEKGAFADILVVKGDPLESWEVLAEPSLVMREGVVIVSGLARLLK